MSARRTTRASIRLSSRGASPAVTESATTPLRRAGPAALPAVNLRASTAYGQDPLFLATTRAGRHTGQVIENVLGDLLEPVREDVANPSQATRGEL